MPLRYLSYFCGCLALIAMVYYSARGFEKINRYLSGLEYLSEHQMRLSIGLANTSAALLAEPDQAHHAAEQLNQLLAPSRTSSPTLQSDRNLAEVLHQKQRLQERLPFPEGLEPKENAQILQQFREGLEILSSHNQQMREHQKQAVIRALSRLFMVDGILLLLAMGCIGIPLSQQQRSLLKSAQQNNKALEEKAHALQQSHRTIGNMLQDMVVERRKASLTSETNARLAALIDSADDAILSLNLVGYVVTANNAALKTFGAYCQGKRFTEHFSGATEQQLATMMAQTQQQKIGANMNVVLERDNKQLTFALTLSPLRSSQGEFIGFSVIAKDITRSQKEQERFRLAVEAAPNAMIMINQAGQIVLFNTEAQHMFGYAAEELSGQSIHQLVPTELRNAHRSHIKQFFRSPVRRTMGRDRGELQGRRKSGECFPIEVGLTPVESENEYYVISSIVDISERQRQQAQLNALNNELLRKNQEMEQFIYTVSHDLKAPLVTIAGFATRLRNTPDIHFPDKQIHQIDRILANVKAMDALLQDLLHLSRIIKRDLQKTWINSHHALEKALDSLEGHITETGAEITIESPLADIYAQESLLLQCLQNLVSNALKYTKPGEKPRVHIAGIVEEQASGIAVRDHGLGIAPQHQERVFNVFERLNPQTCEGTGVGLSIVKAIMEKHSGRVSLSSTEGIGTEFILLFPYPPQKEVSDE